MKQESQYDVFLSHNSADKPAVEALASRLMDEVGLEPFLDKWHLVPGKPWQEAIEEAIDQSRTCAVFIGPHGLGPWAHEEMRAAIEQRIEDKERDFRVIPVLLPGAERGERGRLPAFLIRATWVEFRESLSDTEAFRRLVAGIKGIPPGRGANEAVYEGECPYRGLQVFSEEHARFFFGRDAATEWLVNDLRSSRFLAVVGPSGSGKSSLVRAGLVPALRKAALSKSEKLPLYLLKPGHRPLERLALALNQLFSINDPTFLPRLMDTLASDHRQLHLTIQQVLHETPAKRRVVLVVDQFEELFTLCRDDKQRQAFIENLLYASSIEAGQTVVILTMRADFYSKCAAYPDLAARLTDHQMLVSPMTEEELRQAIVRPAKLVGLEFEGGLVEALLTDVQAEPGALPLLAHTLLELWNKRKERLLTFAAYREIGGVQGAIAHRAESIYADFDATQQHITRRIMLRLTQPGEGTEDTRRRATLKELLPVQENAADVEATVQKLADARLLTTSQDEHKHEILDVAHEALIRGWPRLQGWIDENRAGLRIHRRLTEAAIEWDEKQRDEGYLYRNARLVEAEGWAEHHNEEMNVLEQTFLNASRTAQVEQENQERRVARFRFRAFAVIVVLIIVVLSVGWWSTQREVQQERKAKATAQTLQKEAQKQQTLAESRTLAAQAQLALDQDLQLAILLGVEAVDKTSSISFMTEEAGGALYDALAVHPRRVMTLHEGHIDSVSHVAWSTDNRRILTASHDGDVRVWDALNGALLLTLSEHSNSVTHAAWSSDSSRILTASSDESAKVWDAASGALLLTLSGHSFPVNHAAWNGDGGRILTASGHSTTVWDAQSGVKLLVLSGHSDWVNHATWSGNSSRILTASDDGSAKVWDAQSGELLLTLSGHSHWVNHAVWSHDSSRIVTASADYSTKVWDAENGEELLTLSGHSDSVIHAAWSGDSSRIVTASWDGSAKVWDSESGEELLTLSEALSEDSFPLNHAAWSSDDSRIVTASDDGSAKVWDAESGEELLALSGHSNWVILAIWSHDSSQIVTASLDSSAKVWNAESGALHLILSGHSNWVNHAAWSHDSSRILTASWDESAKVWDAKSGEKLLTLSEHSDSVIHAVWSHDSSRILTASYDGSAKVWDAESGEELLTLSGHSDSVNHATWSHDSSRILTASSDGSAKVWDAENGEELLTLSGHSDPVNHAIWSHDSSRILTASVDRSAKVWDAESGEELLTLIGHKDSVIHAAWSHDSRGAFPKNGI